MKREIIPVILAKDFTDFKKKLAVIKKLRPKPRWIQIDVVDGKFAPYRTYSNPKQMMAELVAAGLQPAHLKKRRLKPAATIFNVEVDLMVVDPLKHAKAWIKAGAKRILFHAEIFNRHPEHSEEPALSLSKGSRTHVRDSHSAPKAHSPLAKREIPRAARNDSVREIIKYVKKQGAEAGLSLNPSTPLSHLSPYIKKVDTILLLGVNPGKSGQPFQKPMLKKIRALRKKHPLLPIEVDGGVNLDNAEEILKAGATQIATASALHNAPDPQIAYQKFLKVARHFK